MYVSEDFLSPDTGTADSCVGPRRTSAVMCRPLASPLASNSATVAGSPTPWPACGGGGERREPQGSWVKVAGEGATEYNEQTVSVGE